MNTSNKTNKKIDLSKITITSDNEIILKSNNNKPTFEELQEAAKPLIDILYKYYNPHTTILVEQTCVEIVCGNMVVPIKSRD
jgi:hypothetical protein